MSDCYPAEIHIGGAIRLKLLDKLIRVMAADGASLNGYGEPAATKETLRTALQEGDIVSLYDDRARNGCFSKLEEFLVQNHIFFDRHSDAFCEYNAENVYFRGGKNPLVMDCDQAGNLMFRADELMEILKQESLSDPDKVKILRRIIHPPECFPLPPIRFVKE